MSRAATIAPQQRMNLLAYRARAQAYQLAYLYAREAGAIEEDCDRIRREMDIAFAVFREYREHLIKTGVRA